MRAPNDPLDESGESPPASPVQRRRTILIGLLLAGAILGALIWFSVTNTETKEERGLFGFSRILNPLPVLT